MRPVVGPSGKAFTGSLPSGALPSGTVTFLFTDVEGSTRRWEARSRPMAAAIERHDTILQNAVESHGGYVFKRVGDGICATFSRASEALDAALEAERVLHCEDFTAVDELRVRMAMHTGEAQERGGDYFGPAVNRVARLLAVGNGGQILISGVTADLLRGEPALPELLDLGFHRLKDLNEPEHIFQVRTEHAPRDFPPLHSLDVLPNNLPLQLTSFIGRSDELSVLAARLEESRLVTLVGSGGVGKTRLAIQLGGHLAERYPDGVWLFEFAPVSDPALVPTVVASTLNIRESQDRSILESILLSLGRKRALLLFDNCEQVIEPAAGLCGAILRSVPNVRIVATSRQALGITGEWIHRVASLPFPASRRALSARSAQNYGAIALFVERATAANQQFELTDENIGDVLD
ncbi:MAG: adenylate/guanylate cyclase domain-containing protein, partial [Candidatus Eremiobacteraeota bacterium]|nr:adenylate/guanylate cyclase domain-containing protein [Candidatus Eremiobacteraeota bacterium]